MVVDVTNEESSAMKNIKDVIEGGGDGVILLTDVYSEDPEDLDADKKYSKHKEVLENINDTLDFINGDVVQHNGASSNKTQYMLKSLEVRDSLKKLHDAKMQQAQKIGEKVVESAPYTSVEQLLINLLKPQIALWLNQHLPPIVEKEVKGAIEKILDDNK